MIHTGVRRVLQYLTITNKGVIRDDENDGEDYITRPKRSGTDLDDDRFDEVLVLIG